MRILIGLLFVFNVYASENIKIESIDSITNDPDMHNVLRLETAIRNDDSRTFQDFARNSRSVQINGRRVDLNQVETREESLQDAINRVLVTGGDGTTGGG